MIRKLIQKFSQEAPKDSRDSGLIIPSRHTIPHLRELSEHEIILSFHSLVRAEPPLLRAENHILQRELERFIP